MFVTAWHVFKDLADSDDELTLVSSDRNLTLDSDKHPIAFMPVGDNVFDTGLIVVRTEDPIFSASDLLPTMPCELALECGAELGWLGFPGLAEPELCFFHGYVSGHISPFADGGGPETYLVDGVGVNGVSGGPAFTKRGLLVGIISAYIPNRVDSHTTLPGLMAVVPINAISYWLDRPNELPDFEQLLEMAEPQPPGQEAA